MRQRQCLSMFATAFMNCNYSTTLCWNLLITINSKRIEQQLLGIGTE